MDKLDIIWTLYFSMLILNTILIDCFYISHACLQKSTHWLHQISLQSAKEYDPLWVSCGHAVRGSTGLSVIAVLLFSIVVFPTLLVGEGFGKYRSFTRSIAYLFCHLFRTSAAIFITLELYHSWMYTELAPKYNTFHWILIGINLLTPSMLLSRLRNEDKTSLEAEQLLGKTRGKGKFRKFAMSKLNSFTESDGFKKKLKHIFKTVDIDNSGSIDKKEAYSMVLLLYLYVAQYTTIYGKTVPSVEEIMKLYDKIDVNGDGKLNFEEFESMAIVLFEEVSTRVSTQIFSQLCLAPLIAYGACIVLRDYVIVGFVRDFLLAILPTWTIKYIFTETICTTVITALVNMNFIPFFMNIWTMVFVGDKVKDRRRSVRGDSQRGGGFFRVIIDLLQDFFG